MCLNEKINDIPLLKTLPIVGNFLDKTVRLGKYLLLSHVESIHARVSVVSGDTVIPGAITGPQEYNSTRSLSVSMVAPVG